jgi:hypothetical protein
LVVSDVVVVVVNGDNNVGVGFKGSIESGIYICCCDIFD